MLKDQEDSLTLAWSVKKHTYHTIYIHYDVYAAAVS